jgi:serine/threonine protein kinase
MAIMTIITALFSELPSMSTPLLYEPTQAAHKADKSKITLVPSQPSIIRRPTLRHSDRLRKAISLHISHVVSLRKSRPGSDAASIKRLSTPDIRSVRNERPFLERCIPIRCLGTGGNGEVHLCHNNSIGTLVAVKTIHHPPTTTPTEVQILHLLGQHTKIVQYHRMLDHPTLDCQMQLVFDYCAMGDLADYVNEDMEHTPGMFLWHVLKHVANGLQYMHSQGIVHSDIKPANILLTHRQAGEFYPLPKLAKFGAAALNNSHDIPLGHTGTFAWQAPEADWRTGPEADVWALGCVAHELAVRSWPCMELGEPDMGPEMWFDLGGWVVPPEIPYVKEYKELWHCIAFHPPAPVRIDRASDDNLMLYSKLLNWVMMRAGYELSEPHHSERASPYSAGFGAAGAYVYGFGP